MHILNKESFSMLPRFRIIAILCLISSLARFVLDSYLPSMPAISQSFAISDTQTQFTLTLYLLGFSISQLIYGPLSDRYGRRSIIIVGLGIFAFGNLMCAMANSLSILLVARLIAGVGAGSCGVLNRAIASDCFKGAEFSKAWSYTTTSLVITLCVAPVLGGYIQEIWGWRANFMLTTLFVAVVLSLIFKYLPETNTHLHSQKSSLKLKDILQDYNTILASRTFLTGALCYTLAFSGLIAYFQVSPLLFINNFKLSPSEYGWCSLVIAANYLVGGMVVTKFATRMGTQVLLLIGTFFLILGGLLMWLAYAFNYSGVSAVLFPAAVYVIGARIVIPNAIAGAMEKLRHLNGSSSALIGCIQMLGSFVISLIIANFNNTTAFPLSLVLITMGILTLGISLLDMRRQIAEWVSQSMLWNRIWMNNTLHIIRIIIILFAILCNPRFFTICKNSPYIFCVTETVFQIISHT